MTLADKRPTRTQPHRARHAVGRSAGRVRNHKAPVRRAVQASQEHLDGIGPHERATPPQDASAKLTMHRARSAGSGWAVFAGLILTLAAFKEILRRLTEQPITARARRMSRADSMLGGALILRALERAGRAVLGNSDGFR